jgi:hypothetical protein
MAKNVSGVFISYLLAFILVTFLISSCRSVDDQSVWLRGNMHTHTFWSDGDDFPESVAKWYKENNYDFLVFTDHNILLETPTTGPVRGNHRLIDGYLWQRIGRDHPAFVKYEESFGKDWVGTRQDDDEDYIQVRLQPLDEFRKLFEEPGKFILMMGNEISDRHAVHILGFHQDEVIPTAGGNPEERADMIKKIVSNVDDYRERTGRNTYPALAHPNFTWAITAEMMLFAENLRFFEVYNGHPLVNNDGDDFRASTERMWDIVLATRLASGGGNLLYGLATDDAHNYHSGGATPGKGWVMVRSSELREESILDAIDRGDFYSSTGVILAGLEYDGEKIMVGIEPRDGVNYTTEYIGTLSGLDLGSRPALDAEGNEIPNTTRIYNSEIGRVLASYDGLSSSYRFNGDELYVRVKITSSADHTDQITGEVLGKQSAWIQPVIPGVK